MGHGLYKEKQMNERDFTQKKREDWERLAALTEKANGRRGLRGLSREELLTLGPLYRRVASDLAQARARAVSPDLTLHLKRYCRAGPCAAVFRAGAVLARQSGMAVLYDRFSCVAAKISPLFLRRCRYQRDWRDFRVLACHHAA